MLSLSCVYFFCFWRINMITLCTCRFRKFPLGGKGRGGGGVLGIVLCSGWRSGVPQPFSEMSQFEFNKFQFSRKGFGSFSYSFFNRIQLHLENYEKNQRHTFYNDNSILFSIKKDNSLLYKNTFSLNISNI